MRRLSWAGAFGASVGRGGGERQIDLEMEFAAFPERAVHGEGTAHHLDEAARNREAETRAAVVARGADVSLTEGLEDSVARVRRDADAGIDDGKANARGELVAADADGGDGDFAGRRELDR